MSAPWRAALDTGLIKPSKLALHERVDKPRVDLVSLGDFKVETAHLTFALIRLFAPVKHTPALAEKLPISQQCVTAFQSQNSFTEQDTSNNIATVLQVHFDTDRMQRRARR